MGKLIYLNKAAKVYHEGLEVKLQEAEKFVPMTYVMRAGLPGGVLIDRATYKFLLRAGEIDGGMDVREFKVSIEAYGNIVATHPEYLDYFTVKAQVKK